MEVNMIKSILTDVKKQLGGIDEMYTAFDDDIIPLINSEFSQLNQLGVGPTSGFSIDSKEQTWDQFFTDPRLNFIPEYVALGVKLIFDPPQSSYVMGHLKERRSELEWRLRAVMEDIALEQEQA